MVSGGLGSARSTDLILKAFFNLNDSVISFVTEKSFRYHALPACSSAVHSVIHFCFDGYSPNSHFALPFLLNQLVFSLEELYKLYAAYTFIFAAEKEADFCGI